jgi:hypothetical protein
MNPWPPDGGPDLLSDDAQKPESVTGETLLRPSRACCGEAFCRYRAKIKLELGWSQIVAGSCRLDVGDRHDGVAESTLSGERLCRMGDGR